MMTREPAVVVLRFRQPLPLPSTGTEENGRLSASPAALKIQFANGDLEKCKIHSFGHPHIMLNSAS